MSRDAVGRAPARVQAPPLPASARVLVALRRHRRGVLGSASVAAFLMVWQLVGSLNVISADLISYPTQAVATAAQMAASGELGGNHGHRKSNQLVRPRILVSYRKSSTNLTKEEVLGKRPTEPLAPHT